MDMVFAMRCKWTTRRLQRYLDMDPAAQLTQREIMKVRAHLVECDRCSTSVAHYEKMNSVLRRLGESKIPDEASIRRLKDMLDQVAPPEKE